MEQMEQMALVGGFSVAAAFQSTADRRLLSRGGFSVAAASQSLGFSVDGGWQLHG